MPLDMEFVKGLVDQFYANMPHPLAPEIAVKDYAAIAKTAMMVKGDFPEPNDVSAMHGQLQALGISPSQYERAWKLARPLANRLLDRDPTPDEIVHLHEAHPSEYHDYYNAMPHPHYPEISAGEMAKYYHAALPVSQKLAGREPVAHEVARFAMAGYDTESIHAHYKDDW